MTTDQQAFSAIRGRLDYEVGALLKFASKSNIDPFWASLRMIFPIAEAMGDLVYSQGNSKNLYNILNEECDTCMYYKNIRKYLK